MLSRKNQLLASVEVIEGTAPTLDATHYVPVFNVSCQTPQDVEDREVAGSSLSPDTGVPGRSNFALNFEIDAYNISNVSEPVEAPFLKSCGFKVSTIPYLPVTGTPTASTWAGQTLADSSAGTAILAAPVGTSGRMYYIAPAGGFPNADTTIDCGPAVITLSSATQNPAHFCYAYTPDSQQTAIVNLTGAWTGTPTVGETVSNGLDGANAARGVVLALLTNAVEIIPVLPHAAFLSGQTVTGLSSGATNTVHATGQVLYRVPSSTLNYNIDGWYRTGTGCRGNIELSLEAGKVGRWRMQMQGQLKASGDQALRTDVTGVALTNLPRWQNATASVSGFEIPLSRMTVTAGASVSLLEDAHSANGVRGASITAREPVLTADFDQVYAAVVDYQLRMQLASMANWFTMWGHSGPGLRNAVWIPRGQIYAREDGDRNGVLTADLTVRPKRRLGAGDDEIYFMFGV